MKSLEILKARQQVLELKLQERIEKSYNKQYEDDNPITREILDELKDTDEAIKELEELENRSCDGCIHIFKSNNLECSTCLRNYTDRWESRDEVF